MLQLFAVLVLAPAVRAPAARPEAPSRERSVSAAVEQPARVAVRAEPAPTLAPAPETSRRTPHGDGWRTAFTGGFPVPAVPLAVVRLAPCGTRGPAPAPRTCERLPYHANAPPALLHDLSAG